MKTVDKSKTTSLQDFHSQIDYMIKVGIFNHPSNVSKIGDIETNWFKSLSPVQKDKELETATDEWWNHYGKELVNDLYNETLIGTDKFYNNDITKFWLRVLSNEKDNLEKYLGIGGYREKIETNIEEEDKQLKLDIPDSPFDDTDSKDIYTDEDDDDIENVNEWSMKLGDYLKLNNFQLKDDELEEIKKSLQKRRKNGGCSSWMKIGIPFLYQHHRDKLYDYEIEWYERLLNDKD